MKHVFFHGVRGKKFFCPERPEFPFQGKRMYANGHAATRDFFSSLFPPRTQWTSVVDWRNILAGPRPSDGGRKG